MNTAAESTGPLNVPRRIAGLDGLRAISIALVLTGHLAGTKFCYPRAVYEQFGDLANLGVRVFFVISGYLITALLLDEHHKTGSISLRQFYLRRTLRIFPAFFAFMAAIVLLNARGLIDLFPGDLLHAASFTMNYHYVRAWWVGHLWSLSVEEQFYALWPAVLLLLGIRRGLKGAAIALAAAPIVRVAIVLWRPSQVPGIGEWFPTAADTIATGCLMAGLQGSSFARAGF